MTKDERRKKLDNYWYYYKWHTVGAVFILFLAVYTIFEIAGQVAPDLEVVYLSKSALSESADASVNAYFSGIIDDVNGDGKRTVSIAPIIIGDTPDEYSMAMRQKLQLEIFAGEATLFIADSEFKAELEGLEGFSEKVAEISASSVIYGYGYTARPLFAVAKAVYDADKGNAAKLAKYANADRVFEILTGARVNRAE